MEAKKENRGGARPGSGRPKAGRSVTLSVRITPEAWEHLEKLTDNKSVYLDELIKKQPL